MKGMQMLGKAMGKLAKRRPSISKSRAEFDKQFETIRGAKAITKYKSTITPDQIKHTKEMMTKFMKRKSGPNKVYL